MNNFKALLLGSVFVAAGSLAAQAGDIREPAFGGLKDSVYSAPISAPSGLSLKDAPMAVANWYVRGDFGWSSYDEADGFIGHHQETMGNNANNLFNIANGVIFNRNRDSVSSLDIDDTWSIGGGFGRYVSNNIRVDMTFDYRFSSDVTARDDFMAQDSTAAVSMHKTELSSFVTLANIYYDFGDRSGFRPYVGAGLGFSVNRIDDRTIDCGACGAAAVTSKGDTNTDIATAIMVGFSRNLGGALKLDVGYRYLYMGDAQSGNELANPTDSQGQLQLEDMTAHEIRVGLRYDLYR